nr:hypothetical protein Cplu_363 [Cedratvirus plubellavi]
MQPEELELEGAIFAEGNIFGEEYQRYNGVLLKGGFTLHVPLWRFDSQDLGEIPVPEETIKATQLLRRIHVYYRQPVNLAYINYIETQDPEAAGELDEYKERILAGEKILRSDLMGGLIHLEGFAPRGRNEYSLLLGS